MFRPISRRLTARAPVDLRSASGIERYRDGAVGAAYIGRAAGVPVRELWRGANAMARCSAGFRP